MQALAMLSSDALSSIAYGPEQVVLIPSSSLINLCKISCTIR
jgi:hypothetical protein